MSEIEILGSHQVHGGTLTYVRHASAATTTPMRFSIFVPEGEGPFPSLIWLSGLTCTEENFTAKAGAYRAASAHKMIIVAPDTSPRGEGVADDAAYDLGQGAGFYINATEAPWAPHFQMERYITRDLLAAVDANFPTDPARRGVSGHSMGGHGALTLALKYPDLFKSVSAFAPIVSPTTCDWGGRAFTAYLGTDESLWTAHDACCLIAAGAGKSFDDILVDQGLGDNFLENQLRPERLEAAAAEAGIKVTVRRQPGYDHSYFFMASFIDDHVAFHAARL